MQVIGNLVAGSLVFLLESVTLEDGSTRACVTDTPTADGVPLGWVTSLKDGERKLASAEAQPAQPVGAGGSFFSSTTRFVAARAPVPSCDSPKATEGTSPAAKLAVGRTPRPPAALLFGADADHARRIHKLLEGGRVTQGGQGGGAPTKRLGQSGPQLAVRQ